MNCSRASDTWKLSRPIRFASFEIVSYSIKSLVLLLSPSSKRSSMMVLEHCPIVDVHLQETVLRCFWMITTVIVCHCCKSIEYLGLKMTSVLLCRHRSKAMQNES